MSDFWESGFWGVGFWASGFWEESGGGPTPPDEDDVAVVGITSTDHVSDIS